jgi:hypothetical protein
MSKYNQQPQRPQQPVATPATSAQRPQQPVATPATSAQRPQQPVATPATSEQRPQHDALEVDPDAVGSYSEVLECKVSPDGSGMVYRLRMRSKMRDKVAERTTEWLPRHMFNQQFAVANRSRTDWVVGDTRGLML